MSSELFPPIPAETVKSARAIFGRSNFYLEVGDQANRLFSGLQQVDSIQRTEKEARRLAMYHLITIFQFIETLPDLLALDALRERLDWKYALHLPLYYPFREASAFCEFRRWLLEERARMENFQTLLSRLSGLTEVNGMQRLHVDAGHVIQSVCRTSRLAKIWDAMKQCLETLAVKRHDWLRMVSLPHWYDRYRHPSHELDFQAGWLEQEALAKSVGADGFYLLEKISCGDVPALSSLAEVQALRHVWSQQYEYVKGEMFWKKKGCSGCSCYQTNNFRSSSAVEGTGGD